MSCRRPDPDHHVALAVLNSVTRSRLSGALTELYGVESLCCRKPNLMETCQGAHWALEQHKLSHCIERLNVLWCGRSWFCFLMLRKKLIVVRLVEKFPTTFGTWTCLKQPNASFCPEPYESDQNSPTVLIIILLNIILLSTPRSYELSLSFSPVMLKKFRNVSLETAAWLCNQPTGKRGRDSTEIKINSVLNWGFICDWLTTG
jgi:hypothetical protein